MDPNARVMDTSWGVRFRLAMSLELADIWSADADGLPVTVAVGWIAFWGLVVVSVNA